MGASPALVDPARWPRRPYCTDELTAGVSIRALASALKRRYIQVNPPHLRVWLVFDVDRAGAALLWEDCNLPCPSWIAENLENLHAHLVWGLVAPVLVDSPDMRQAPLRYLCAVEAAFRARLGADPGYSGLMTKNPLHGHWRVSVGPRMDYSLDELAARFDDLPRYVKAKPEAVGLGRNCCLFEDLRKWAYKNIRVYRFEGLPGWNPWVSACHKWALQRNGDFSPPLDAREVWHVVKSVSKWTWRNMTLEGWRRWVAKTHASEIQAARGRKSGVVRLAASEENRASARLMTAKGMTQAVIAAELGVTERTVRNWLHD